MNGWAWFLVIYFVVSFVVGVVRAESGLESLFHVLISALLIYAVASAVA